MRKFLLSLTVLAGATVAAASSAHATPYAVPLFTGPAHVQVVDYREDWRFRQDWRFRDDQRRREIYEEARRHEEHERWEHRRWEHRRFWW